MNTSWRAALQDCLRELPAPRREKVARRDAWRRLLAETIVADRDYPAADLGTMDGYALGAEAGDSFQVEGENRPGAGAGDPLPPGTARRIFTGAALPAGAVRVVPQEMTERNGDRVRIVEFPDSSFVRAQGSEARRGDVLLSPGRRLGAVELAAIATVGVAQVEVTARPRLGHLVTGDEIADPDGAATTGTQIRDSNSDLVAAIVRGIGQTVTAHRRVNDEREKVFAAVAEMTREVDVLLMSGGASVGDHDHARAALEAAGFSFVTHGVKVRPGKPVGLARRGAQWAVALPGNPVSHLVALHLFVLPLLRALEGEKKTEPELIQGVLAGELSAEVPRRDTFWPAEAVLADGRFQVRPRRFLTSGDLLGTTGTQALLFLPADIAPPAPGAEINFLSLDLPFA